MTFLLLVPAILSLLVLGAHFLRNGWLILVLGTLGLLACLVTRRAWVPRVVQAALVLGALEQTRTLVILAAERMREGQPYVRLLVILGSVVIVTIVSALLFETARLKRRYALPAAPPAGPPP